MSVGNLKKLFGRLVVCAILLICYPLHSESETQSAAVLYWELSSAKFEGDTLAMVQRFRVGVPTKLAGISTTAILAKSRDSAMEILNQSLFSNKQIEKERDFLLGLIYLKEQQWQNATQMFLKLTRTGLGGEYKGCEDLNFGVLKQIHGVEQPINQFKNALQGSCAEGAFYNLVTLYSNEKKLQPIQRLTDSLLKAEDQKPWLKKAVIMARAKMIKNFKPLDDWVTFLKKHVDQSPVVPELQVEFGRYLAGRGHLENALEYYNRAVSTYPLYPVAWMELATLQFRLKNYVLAEKCAIRAAQTGASASEVYYLQARILKNYRTSPDWIKIRELLEKGLAADPNHRAMAQMLHDVYLLTGNGEGASNIKETFWFHFAPPEIPQKHPDFGPWKPKADLWLKMPG